MVAVDVSKKMKPSGIFRDAAIGKPTSDYSRTPATITITWLWTKGGGTTPENPYTASADTLTVDYAST